MIVQGKKPAVLVTSKNVEKLSLVFSTFVGTVLFFGSRKLEKVPHVKGITTLDHTATDYICELSDTNQSVDHKPLINVEELSPLEIVKELHRMTGARLNTYSNLRLRFAMVENGEIVSTDEMPSLPQQAKTLVDSLVVWAKKGMKVVSFETLEERMAICRACEFWNPQGFKGTGRCKKCGCSTQAKLRMATASCPINKWKAVD